MANIADSPSTLDDIADAFLRAHAHGVLATGRRDGSPQQSMVVYAVLADDTIVMSTKSYTAKWNNALRQSNVSLAINDGRTCLVLYGTVTPIEADPARAEFTADVFAAMSGASRPDPSTLTEFLDAERRTVLQLTVSRAIYHE